MRFLLPILFAALLSSPGAAWAACTVQQRASVPFTVSDGHLLVPVMVNGTAASFVVDTGGERSLVTPQAVHRLHLALDQWVATTMQGVGGGVEHADADPRSLSLGGMSLHRATIAHDTSFAVGELPGLSVGTRIDGLLGRDFLSPFDLQLDMVTRRLTLYTVQDCSGRFLPWTQPYTAVPAISVMQHALVLPITLDGQRLSAMLESGASGTLLSLPGMIRMGLTPALLAHGPASRMHGLGPQPPDAYRHRFTSLVVGNETIRDPVLWVSAVRLLPIVDALLGADWLQAQSRVWLSFATSQVFFTPR